jgi:lipopolysaccharide/colanic/teichoic acid biosynthesis glycosyltransferase
MSLIGNRPLPAGNLQLLRQYDGWTRRFDSPAGISGIAQVVGRLELKPEQRLALESAYSDLYERGNVLRCDFWIFFYTLRLILFSKGIPVEKALELTGAKVATETLVAAD